MGLTPLMESTVVYVIGTYPLLTTTFIDREIEALRSSGIDVRVVSVRRPQGPLSEAQRATVDEVTYVLPVSLLPVIRSHIRHVLRAPGSYFGALWALTRGRHSSVSQRFRTLLHFVMAVHITDLVEALGPTRVHAHFLDRATTVAMVASRLLDVPYSATAHANDIYVDPVLIREKISASDFVATCTGYNVAHLSTVGDPDKIHLIHHGLDLDSYVVGQRPASGSPTIVAVGQLKEKKGFRYLVEACRLLSASGVDFRCEIVGEGPLRQDLETQIARSGLEGVVELLGAIDHRSVIDHLQAATVFTLPSVVTADGDRDGIPNVILEAMAVGLPVVSTRVSAIPEVVVHDVTGILVDPEDAVGLAQALGRLLSDADLRTRMSEQARTLVERSFDVERNVAELRDLLTRKTR